MECYRMSWWNATECGYLLKLKLKLQRNVSTCWRYDNIGSSLSSWPLVCVARGAGLWRGLAYKGTQRAKHYLWRDVAILLLWKICVVCIMKEESECMRSQHNVFCSSWSSTGLVMSIYMSLGSLIKRWYYQYSWDDASSVMVLMYHLLHLRGLGYSSFHHLHFLAHFW